MKTTTQNERKTEMSKQETMIKEIDPMNTNAKHTPGPWTAASQDTETNEIPIKCGKSILARVAPRPHWDATQEANAALIASAPDLLAALKSAVSYLESNRPKGKIREIFTQLNEYENGVLKPARAAIAQAEGGAQ